MVNALFLFVLLNSFSKCQRAGSEIVLRFGGLAGWDSGAGSRCGGGWPSGAMVPIDGNSASWSRLDANAVTTCTGAV